MIRHLFAAMLASAALFVCLSCSSDTGVTEKSRTAPPDPSWVGAISMHSNGAMSRHQPIRILFLKDVIPADRKRAYGGWRNTRSISVARLGSRFPLRR